MEYYGLFGSITAKPDKGRELAEILKEAADLLGSDKGCLHYIVGVGKNPDTVWVYETWTTKQAHDDSLKREDVLALIGKARPLFAEMGDNTEFTIIGGKGL